jgi:hypothetical protein
MPRGLYGCFMKRGGSTPMVLPRLEEDAVTRANDLDWSASAGVIEYPDNKPR